MTGPFIAVHILGSERTKFVNAEHIQDIEQIGNHTGITLIDGSSLAVHELAADIMMALAYHVPVERRIGNGKTEYLHRERGE